MNTFVENEMYLSTEYIKRNSLLPREKICVEGDSLICGYLKETLHRLGVPAQSDDFSELWYIASLESYDENTLCKRLELSKTENSSLLLIILLENINPNSTIRRYAEMELISVTEKLKALRKLIKGSGHSFVKLLLCDRLFGTESDALSLSQILKEAQNNGHITVSEDDIKERFSALYVPDLIDAVFTVSKHGKYGNAYNAVSYSFDRFEIKTTLYRLLNDQGVTLESLKTNSLNDVSYAALSDGKLRSLGFENVCEKDDALRYTCSALTNRYDFFSPFIAGEYDGKLSAIRSIQLEMFREFDRICRKHDIPYFLSGGSMLGAVRHLGYIPWDDDIDVAFIREHYNKFKAVVKEELDSKFLYQNFEDHNGYHYFYDRISSKNTYFATKYSDGYEMHKGISVDIFVFDNAPENAKKFWKHLMNKRLVMNVRWKNVARKDKAYLLSKLLLPFLRLKSMDSYSLSYDKATRKYEHRETGFVLPPATDHNYKGSMPKDWFSSVIPAKFEGIDSFIPQGYDGYLKRWYGDDYMTVLPLCKRRSYHDYFRLDAGANTFDQMITFDDRGELL